LHRSRNDELRYAHTTLNCKYIRTMVYEDHLNFSSKISVDRPWRIKNRDSISSSQSGARPDLSFRSGWQRHAKAGWDHGPLPGRQQHRRVVGDCGQEIEPGRELALVGRQRQVGRVRQPFHQHVDLFHT
jgi:hypothetical protein